MVNWLITGSVLHGMPFSLDLSPLRRLKVSSEKSRLTPLSTKSGWFVTGHYGSSIFTAIHSVLSVPCLPTAATAAASKPFQWLTRQFHWLPDGFWHWNHRISWARSCFGMYHFYEFHVKWIFSWNSAYTYVYGNDIILCGVYPCTNSPRSSMSRTSRVWTWKKHFWAR